MEKKVFVTGADGMLGSSICRKLIEQQYTVKAACLHPERAHTISSLPIEIVYGNILDTQFLVREMRGCDYVIHVAASTSVWPRRCRLVNEINILGTEQVMEVAQFHNVQRMVHIGSASSFGHGCRQRPGNEKRLFDGWKYGMDYIESKYRAQQILLAQHEKNGFPVVIVNPTYMIGPYDAGPSSGRMLLNLYRNAIPGYSSGGKNFVCSQDVAVAAVHALQLGRVGECYIAGNQNMSFKDFFKTASSVMGKKFTLKPVPHPLILFAGAFHSTWARVSGKAPKLSYGVAQMANVQQYFSAEKAVRELQMPQTPIEVGIGQCMHWFNENGYLQ